MSQSSEKCASKNEPKNLGPAPWLHGIRWRRLRCNPWLNFRRKSTGSLPTALDKKLGLLGSEGRAHILDELQRLVLKDVKAIAAIAAIVGGEALSQEQATLLTEQVVRLVTLFGDIDAKVTVLREFMDDKLTARAHVEHLAQIRQRILTALSVDPGVLLPKSN
jgi:hypothetical protein